MPENSPYLYGTAFIPFCNTVNCMDDLTVEQVIAFHKQVMENEGGDDRLLSEAGLHQMVFSVNRIEDVYPRAALAFFTLVAYPAFREGNSRTAQLVAEMILILNGYTLKDGDADMTALVQGIASFTFEQADIEEWLHSHYKKTSDPGSLF
jgi:death-on-curing family protein